jgi:non-homologous end joining protein Ku
VDTHGYGLRLQDKFTRVLDNFKRVNREAEDRDREVLVAAKQDTEVEAWERGRGYVVQSKTLTMLKEEKINQLQDRERSMRQLESDITKFKVGSTFYCLSVL